MTWIRIRIWIHFFPVRIRIRIKIKWILSTALKYFGKKPKKQDSTDHHVFDILRCLL